MRSTVRTVAELFSNARGLSLPYFQRGYAWRPEHCERLLDDIVAAMDGKFGIDWYPLGTMTVADSDPEGAQALSIADGHQRLTTLTILIALLRDVEPEPGLRSRLHGLVVRGEDDENIRLHTTESAADWLIALVQRRGSTLLAWDEADEIPENARNILRNRDYLKKRLASFTAHRRQLLAAFLLDRCVANVVEVGSDAVARLLFSTMHDTGLKPAEVDLFKSEVLDAVGQEAREDCQIVWEDIEARLGSGGMQRLLRHIAVIRSRTMSSEPTEVVLRKTFDFDRPEGSRELVERYILRYGTRLAEGQAAALGAPSTGEAGRRLQYLSWVRNHDTWVAPVLHWLETTGSSLGDAVPFLRRIETLAWVQMILAVQGSHRDARYLRLIKEIDAGRALEPGGVLDIPQRDRQEVRRILRAPNFTRRPYKLFLLLRACAATEGDRVVTVLPPATIEHIFPGNPAAGSRWLRDFTDAAEAKELRHALGNLTLLTVQEQNRASNEDYDVKQPVLAGSVFALSRAAAMSAVWRPEDVRRRGGEVIELLMRSWDIAD